MLGPTLRGIPEPDARADESASSDRMKAAAHSAPVIE
jgi:hypothetical protein